MYPSMCPHYEVTLVRGRREALAALAAQEHDLVLLDVPSIRFDLARFCHDLQTRFPGIILFLWLSPDARVEDLPPVQEQLTHPITSRQLLSRLSRLLPEQVGEVVVWQGLQLDPVTYALSWQATDAFLTPKQAALAVTFIQAPEGLLSRAKLMAEVWGTDYLGDTRTLDVHIYWLRQALKSLDSPFKIETVRGQGYRLINRLKVV
ncbi:MAG: winged helix-turn-helix domain-containing protein [Chloroflexota bacterium]|nr:winged helix-turn-helix domain-containing protein [Chloroflexota bacterium]